MRSGEHAPAAPEGNQAAVIHTEDLTKVYPGTDFAAVDRLNLDVQGGRDLRAAGTQRRGQDDDRGDADHAGGADVRAGVHRRASTSARTRRWPNS